MKTQSFLGLLAFSIAAVSCNNTKSTTVSETTQNDSVKQKEEAAQIDPGHNSQNSLDWPGQYKGTIPCADCEGIEVTLAIQEDGAYYRTLNYLGKPSEPVLERGKFQWNTTGNYIRLQLPNSLVQWYQVGEDVLYHLDNNGKRIEGELAELYTLRKVTGDAELENRQWILIELKGKSVVGAGALRNPHLRFDGVRKRVSGNDGCNSYMGEYQLSEDQMISFGMMASTEMFCEGDSISKDYYQALGEVSRYSVGEEVLTLSNQDMELLKFRRSSEE